MLAGGCYSSKLAKLLGYLLGSASLAILLPSEVGTFSLSVIVCMPGEIETEGFKRLFWRHLLLEINNERIWLMYAHTLIIYFIKCFMKNLKKKIYHFFIFFYRKFIKILKIHNEKITIFFIVFSVYFFVFYFKIKISWRLI